jgi:hypothetical protein
MMLSLSNSPTSKRSTFIERSSTMASSSSMKAIVGRGLRETAARLKESSGVEVRDERWWKNRRSDFVHGR